MDLSDIKVIFVLLFFILASFLIGFFKKIKNKVFKPAVPVYTVQYTFKNHEPVTLDNQTVIIQEDLIKNACLVYNDLQDMLNIEKGPALDRLKPLEDEFYAHQENKAFATAAIKTFKAWHNGAMLRVLDPDNQFSENNKKMAVPDINKAGFQDFVYYSFLGIQNAEMMPQTMEKIQKQYAVFFTDYTLKENEFLLTWAMQCMMTNQNLIVFKSQDVPEIEHCIPLPDLQAVRISQTGSKKLR